MRSFYSRPISKIQETLKKSICTFVCILSAVFQKWPENERGLSGQSFGQLHVIWSCCMILETFKPVFHKRIIAYSQRGFVPNMANYSYCCSDLQRARIPLRFISHTHSFCLMFGVLFIYLESTRRPHPTTSCLSTSI